MLDLPYARANARMDSKNPNSLGSDATDASQIGAWLNSIDRNECFAGLFFLGCANGIAARAIAVVHSVGWPDAAIHTFEVSAIVLTACVSGLRLTMCRGSQLVTPIDLVISVVALALIALPIGALSWIAVSGLALYILLSTGADLPMRRGAIILLATTVPMLWSRLLLQFFANFILEIDASLVGWLLGTDRTGNLVRFANDNEYLVIFPPCSSLANMSLALLCWITVSELSGHRRALSDLWWCLLVCGSVVAVNVGRMTVMGISVQHYEVVHSPIGDAVTNVMILIVALGWSVLGVRREIFSRA
jgi:hypothetical protein